MRSRIIVHISTLQCDIYIRKLPTFQHAMQLLTSKIDSRVVTSFRSSNQLVLIQKLSNNTLLYLCY